MPLRRFERHVVPVTWGANGPINLELSPKPYTITRMAVMFNGTSETTTTATNFNDYWDRDVATLSLAGQGKVFFNFLSMRPAQHGSRYFPPAFRRPTVIANSSTAVQAPVIGQMLHFGVAPRAVRPGSGIIDDNPFDLTAGIPPSTTGNLTLGGTFGSATAKGTNVTVNAGQLIVYLWGIQPLPTDQPQDWMPRAIPVWQHQQPNTDVAALSGLFSTQRAVPAGDFLHRSLVMTTQGTNAPRANFIANQNVFGSFQVFNQLESREIWRADDYVSGEIISQISPFGMPTPSEDVTGSLGVPALTQMDDQGLLYLPFYQLSAERGHPLYGVDLRNVATGDLQFRFGVNNATTTTLDIVHYKYQLNPNHPSN